MNAPGWQIIPDVVPAPLLLRLKGALAQAWHECHRIMEDNGIDNADNTVHHLLATAIPEPFLDLLSAYEKIDPQISDCFYQSKYVLHSLGGAINRRGQSNYSHEIHRDIRTHQREPFVLNTLVMLDDFTAENGATWLGGRTPFAGGSESFYNDAVQAIGSAGSVLIFDSNTWHAGGVNRTDAPRRSLTPLFAKPWIKPGFDYCRALGERGDLSEYQRQVIGYHARVPSTLSEWYRHPDERFYRGDQG